MKKVTVSNTVTSLKAMGSVGAGLATGVFLNKKVPAKFAPYAPLAVGFIGLFAAKNINAKMFFASHGATGALALIKKFTDGKTGVLSAVNNFTPALSGTGVGRLGRLGNIDVAGGSVAENLLDGLGQFEESNSAAEMLLANT